MYANQWYMICDKMSSTCTGTSPVQFSRADAREAAEADGWMILATKAYCPGCKHLASPQEKARAKKKER